MTTRIGWAVVTCLLAGGLVCRGENVPEIQLTVHDAATHQPLAGIKVHIAAYTNPSPELDVVTDDKGQLKFTVPPNTSSVMMQVKSDSFVPKRLHWKAASLPATYDLELNKGVVVGGRVTDDAGQPISDAKVVLIGRVEGKPKTDRNAVETEGVNWLELKTDADGKWHFGGMPAAFTDAEVGVVHLDYVSHSPGSAGYYPLQKIDDRETLLQQSLVMKLERGKAIHGTVLDDAGKPIAGAKVGIGSDRIASNVVPEAKTDEAGHFTLHARPGENITLTARANQHSPAQAMLQMGDADQSTTIRLGGSHPLAGRVIDTAGKPVEGVTVYFESIEGRRVLNKQIKSDADGKFSWPDAPEQEIGGGIYSEKYKSERKINFSWSRDNVITVHEPLKVAGTVLDDETGKPVPNFTVIPGIGFGNGQAVLFQREDYGAGEVKKINAADGRFEKLFDEDYPQVAIRIEADGYFPAESPAFAMGGGPQDCTLRLKHGHPLAAVVTNPSGEPLANVKAALVLPGVNCNIQNGQFSDYDHDSITTQSDANGRLTFPPQTGFVRIVLLDDRGMADVSAEQMNSGKIVLQPWATIQGVAKLGKQAASNAIIEAMADSNMNASDEKQAKVRYNNTATADVDGKFKLTRVPPVRQFVARRVETSDRSYSWASRQNISPMPGETLSLQIGGTGRPVMGRIVMPAELAGQPWGQASATLRTKFEMPENPVKKAEGQSQAEYRAAYAAWAKTSAGIAWMADVMKKQDAIKNVPAVINKDGSFRADDVEPGTYSISIQFQKPTPENQCAFGEDMARASGEVIVPDDHGDSPIEVPTIMATMIKPSLAVGQMAPEFSVPTLDGKTVSLAEHKGKLVLVDFWATWCGPCVGEVPSIKAAIDKHGSDPRFVAMSLSLDEKMDEPKAFAKENGMTWTQGFLGEWNKASVPNDYGVRGIPSLWLIGPDGKVIAKDLRGEAIEPAIVNALANLPK